MPSRELTVRRAAFFAVGLAYTRPRCCCQQSLCSVQALRKPLLVGIHFLWATKANAALLYVRAAGAGAFSDEVALELCDAGKDGHDHLSGVRGDVRQGSEMDWKRAPAWPNRFDDLE
jgi:hypothetical protein